MDTELTSKINSSKRKLIFWLIQFVVWSLYFYYSTWFIHNYDQYISNSVPSHLILYLIFFCYFGIPLSMSMRYLINRVRRTKPSLIKLLLTVIGGSLVLANVWFLEVLILDAIIKQLGYPITPYTFAYYGWEIFAASLLLIGWSSIYLLIKFWEEWKEQKIIAGNALLLAENAQLRMLRYQLNPHFLFNALGSLRALIRKDQDKAVKMVSEISDFLRYSLISKPDQTVSLSEELNAVKHYLEIEGIRFGDKLKVNFDIDPATMDLKVPGFILHPLVENAIKYGMNSSALPLILEIKSKQEDDTLLIEVGNSGKWKYEESEKSGTGTGLNNIRHRLKAIYPDQHTFSIEREDNWVCVTIGIKNITSNGKSK